MLKLGLGHGVLTAWVIVFICLVQPTPVDAQAFFISGDEAVEDLQELRRLLEVESSYSWLGDGSWRSQLAGFESKLADETVVQVEELRRAVTEVLSGLGDRHSGVRARRSRSQSATVSVPIGGELPVAFVRVGLRLVVMRAGGERYVLFDPEYPYLEAIDGMSIDDAIDFLTPEHRLAPRLSRLTLSAWSFRRVGRLKSLGVGDVVKLQLSDGRPPGQSATRDVSVELVEKGLRHVDDGAIWLVYRDAMKQGRYGELSQRLSKRIAYVAIPEMASLDRAPGLKKALHSAMYSALDAEALILDVRSNFGGTREILWEISGYIVPPEVTVGCQRGLHTERPTPG